MGNSQDAGSFNHPAMGCFGGRGIYWALFSIEDSVCKTLPLPLMQNVHKIKRL